MGFQHHAKMQKKLMIQLQENTWTERQKDGQTLFSRTLPSTAGGPVIYLNDFLILGKTLEETILNRDTVISLLLNLGCYKLKEINFSPNSDNRILGDNKHSVNDSASAS